MREVEGGGWLFIDELNGLITSGAKPASDDSEPVVPHVSRQQRTKMVMSHDRIVSHSLKHACFEQSTVSISA